MENQQQLYQNIDTTLQQNNTHIQNNYQYDELEESKEIQQATKIKTERFRVSIRRQITSKYLNEKRLKIMEQNSNMKEQQNNFNNNQNQQNNEQFSKFELAQQQILNQQEIEISNKNIEINTLQQMKQIIENIENYYNCQQFDQLKQELENLRNLYHQYIFTFGRSLTDVLKESQIIKILSPFISQNFQELHQLQFTSLWILCTYFCQLDTVEIQNELTEENQQLKILLEEGGVDDIVCHLKSEYMGLRELSMLFISNLLQSNTYAMTYLIKEQNLIPLISEDYLNQELNDDAKQNFCTVAVLIIHNKPLEFNEQQIQNIMIKVSQWLLQQIQPFVEVTSFSNLKKVKSLAFLSVQLLNYIYDNFFEKQDRQWDYLYWNITQNQAVLDQIIKFNNQIHYQNQAWPKGVSEFIFGSGKYISNFISFEKQNKIIPNYIDLTQLIFVKTRFYKIVDKALDSSLRYVMDDNIKIMYLRLFENICVSQDSQVQNLIYENNIHRQLIERMQIDDSSKVQTQCICCIKNLVLTSNYEQLEIWKDNGILQRMMEQMSDYTNTFKITNIFSIIYRLFKTSNHINDINQQVKYFMDNEGYQKLEDIVFSNNEYSQICNDIEKEFIDPYKEYMQNQDFGQYDYCEQELQYQQYFQSLNQEQQQQFLQQQQQQQNEIQDEQQNKNQSMFSGGFLEE